MGNRKVGFYTIISDMGKMVGIRYWIIAGALALIALLAVLLHDIVIDKKDELLQIFINVIPELLGFLIAGFAIVMGINEGTLKRLSEKADDGKIPIRVICASFTVCTLMLLATLILCIIYKSVDVSCSCINKLFSWLIIGGTLVSVESLFHVVFHLFATSTHLVIKE